MLVGINGAQAIQIGGVSTGAPYSFDANPTKPLKFTVFNEIGALPTAVHIEISAHAWTSPDPAVLLAGMTNDTSIPGTPYTITRGFEFELFDGSGAGGTGIRWLRISTDFTQQSFCATRSGFWTLHMRVWGGGGPVAGGLAPLTIGGPFRWSWLGK